MTFRSTAIVVASMCSGTAAACLGANEDVLFPDDPRDAQVPARGGDAEHASSVGNDAEPTETDGAFEGDSTKTAVDAGVRDAVALDSRVDAPAPFSLVDLGNVRCGASAGTPLYCASDRTCCAHGKREQGGASYALYECVRHPSECAREYDALLTCDGPDDCALGEVCCADASLGPPFAQFYRGICQRTHCLGLAGQFCEVGAPNDCPQGQNCVPTALLGYGICR